ncbi:MAG: 1-acyl-sn-glycerol-3-phosphate acyltransferase [Alphaproteobacteria bacterium]|nr:1-acyl-sn-glycerol-3-phosphate acyltransferase [Alphaproteobacteria bacterium]
MSPPGWSAPRAALSLAAYALFTLVLIPFQALALVFSRRLARRIPVVYHRACRRILGVRVRVRGTRARKPPVLFASNHASYLDIMILASLIPGSFVSKAEVGDWPFFGLLAKLQRTVFISRRREDAQSDRDNIRGRLAAGDNLILFPEGTSSDGNRVLPFKSALFAVADAGGADLRIQPVSITYVHLRGMPMGRHWRPFFAWYGDMEMAPHIWTLAGLGPMTVVVDFHPELRAGDFPNRKALAAHCENVVRAGLQKALAGGIAGTSRSLRAAARRRRRRS